MSRHTWTKDSAYEYEICTRCGMQRRQMVRACPGVNPARHRYRVWEYKTREGSMWIWCRSRQPVPVCKPNSKE